MSGRRADQWVMESGEAMDSQEPDERGDRMRLVAAPSNERPVTPLRALGTTRAASLFAVVAALLAVAGWFGWRQLRPGDGAAPSPPPRSAIDLVAPAGALPNEGGAWLRVVVRPDGDGGAVVGATRVGRTGAPLDGGGNLLAVRVEPLGGGVVTVGEGEQATVEGMWSREPGWWSATVVGEDNVPAAIRFLVPDPNIDGAAALPVPPTSPEAETLYERAMANQSALRSVRFWQTMADGAGVNAFSEHAVLAFGNDPPSFTYRALGGMEAVVIGERMWVRQPGEAWEQREAAPGIPPSRWSEEYEGATGFTLGPTEDVGGERCRLVTFVVPERSESPKRAAAWYAWWVGEESGQLRREAMVSRNHYMLNEFADINAPLAISPPAVPAGGSPVPSAD